MNIKQLKTNRGESPFKKKYIMKLRIIQEEYANLYRLYLDCKSLIEYKNKGESKFMEEAILERMEANLKRYEDEK